MLILFNITSNPIVIKVDKTNIIPPIVGVDFLLLCVLSKYTFNTWSILNFFKRGIKIKAS